MANEEELVSVSEFHRRTRPPNNNLEAGDPRPGGVSQAIVLAEQTAEDADIPESEEFAIPLKIGSEEGLFQIREKL